MSEDQKAIRSQYRDLIFALQDAWGIIHERGSDELKARGSAILHECGDFSGKPLEISVDLNTRIYQVLDDGKALILNTPFVSRSLRQTLSDVLQSHRSLIVDRERPKPGYAYQSTDPDFDGRIVVTAVSFDRVFYEGDAHGSATREEFHKAYSPLPFDADADNQADVHTDGLSMLIQIPVSTQSPATPDKVLQAVEALLNVGMADAVATLEDKELDRKDAWFASGLEIGAPMQIGPIGAPADFRQKSQATSTFCSGHPDHPLPADPEHLNNDRATWAETALTTFRRQTRCEQSDAVADLLSTLIHYCDRHRLVFDDELARALNHYRDEIRDDTYEDPSLTQADAPSGG